MTPATSARSQHRAFSDSPVQFSPSVGDLWRTIARALDRAPDLDQSRRLLARVREAGDNGARVVVLPESAAGLWTPTLGGFWMSGLRGTDKMVIAGAAIVDRQLAGRRARQLYGARMAVPVSIRQAWLGWKGQGGGAKATFFGTRIVEPGGERIAPLICYEQLLVWPVLQSILYAQCDRRDRQRLDRRHSIVAIRRERAQAWARLFALPLVLSFNT